VIGAWRWILALLVMNGHLFTPWWPASFAVFSFYVISGFLMTLILNEKYSFEGAGFKAFWINRVLRLYPSYYLACLLSLVAIFIIPQDFISAINSKIILPTSLYEILSNFFIIGLEQVPNQSSLVPPAWALFIELVYYFVISVWAGKSKTRAWLFLFLGILYLVWTAIYKDFDFQYRYFKIGSGALPFAVGTLLYFYKDQITSYFGRYQWSTQLKVGLGAYLIILVFGNVHWSTLYINLITTSTLIIVLWRAPKNAFKKIDTYLGDLCYPTYLLHWQVGILVIYFADLPYKSVSAFVVALALTTILAALDSRYISGAIETYRRQVKARINDMSKS
jgi:peptidoglycan/LPS O-acetylase OafA/YrhL